jgi:ATP-binding cassette subfamily F protein 3
MILDEPTNHLDLWARDSLERALLNFGGTLLFVSHDRYFVNRVADHLLVVEPGRFRVVDGNYETYLYLSRPGANEGNGAETASDGRGNKPAKSSAKPAVAKAKTKRRFPFRKVADLEEDILVRETRVEELHVLLTDPDVLRDGRRVRAVQAELTEQLQALNGLYDHWQEASELNP